MSHDSQEQTTEKNHLVIKKIKVANFKDNMTVRVKKMNHITEIKFQARVNTNFPIKILSNEEKEKYKADYIHLDTGEYKMFENKAENRSENLESLRRTFARVRDLINNNFTGDSIKEKFITLTYAENMTDVKKLNNNLDYFIKSLKKEIGHFEYLTVIEPQERGAWHAHILLKSETCTYIPYEIINKCWAYRGYTDIKALEGIDNLGAYLVAYLTDLEVDDAHDPLELNIKNRKNKKYEKGARLKLYPPKMKLYRKSKGIVYPTIKKSTYKEAKEEIKKNAGDQPTFSQTVKIFDKNDNHLNTIITEYYNTKRKNLNKK